MPLPRHFRRSFPVGKEASEPFRPDRPKRSASLPSKQNAETKSSGKPAAVACGPGGTQVRRSRPSRLRSLFGRRCRVYVQFQVFYGSGRCRSLQERFCPLSTPLMGRPFRLSSWRRRFPTLPAQSLSILQHFPSFPRSTRVFRSRSWTKCTLIRRPPPIWHGSSPYLLDTPSLWRGRRSWSKTRSADGATCLNRLAASSNKQTPNLL